jgi:hypothetical protein
MASLEERLTAIAERISACPAPDALAGRDQCAHGTWPCATTEAAWLARGIERDDEMRKLREHATREAMAEDARWETQQEIEAAAREGRPPWWETELAEMQHAEPEASA